MQKYLIKILIITIIIPVNYLNATPQFSLHTRNRCINCHLNETGSGVRNEYGWTTVRDFSLLNLQNEFGFIYKSNTLFDEELYFGCDIRGQLARSFKPNSERRFFVKEIALHSAFEFSEWLNLEGSYNFADALYRNHGQQAWSASAVFDIIPNFPRIRIGKFQPSIGIRYDDHTMLIRNFANANIFAKPIIAIDYSDYGLEINHTFQEYGPNFLFNMSGGIFTATNLSNVRIPSFGGELPLVNENNPSFVLKAIANEITGFSNFTTTYAGLSYFQNGDLILLNIFTGVGLYEKFAFLFEYMKGSKTNLLSIDNFMVLLNFHIFQPVFFELRFEQAHTQYSSVNVENRSNQIVAGVHFFPLPYLEIKGEIRYMKTQEKPQIFSQYEGSLLYLQIHLFY